MQMKKILSILSIIILLISCKEVYQPDIEFPETGYLVVEGFINYGSSPTEIKLSRTVKLVDSIRDKPENNAQVFIESENGQTFPLSTFGSGTYRGYANLEEGKKYRLRIHTNNGSQYESEFSQVKKTPDIDSISWKRENDGVRLYVNTKDDIQNSKYFRWKYDETWEIRSSYNRQLTYQVNERGDYRAVFLYPDYRADMSVYYCWKNNYSKNILIGTSEKLTENRIYLPIKFIEPGSEQLSVMYSINLQQYSISQQAYNFYLQMKKNTEQLGTIFDAQPTELKGNIKCINNPSEVVVGYVEVSQEKTKRIFISRSQVGQWNYRSGCYEITIDNHPDSIAKYGLSLTPTIPAEVMDGFITKFNAAEPFCVICTLRGTNVKPAFWP